MKVNELRVIIKRLEYVNEISQGNWHDEIEKCWIREIEILSEDIEGTMSFLKMNVLMMNIHGLVKLLMI